MTLTTGSMAALDRLREGFGGQIIRPGDPDYDQLRRIWNGSIDRYPAVILRPAGPGDVAGAVRFSREREAVTAIRAGGHSIPGYSACDEGVVIDLRLMKGIHVDPSRREAVAQPGLVWGEFDRATQSFGLATPGGEVSDTGIAGLTLGGGIGWLRRTHGLTVDNLVAAELVTADGDLLRVSAEDHPDLFWAIRGGGGNFGVVTSFHYRLHPVGPLVGGMVMHPLERGAEVLRFFRDLAPTLPDEVAANAAVITAPPAPFVPDELRGRPVVALAAAHIGSVDDGERALEPFRRFGPPAIDLLGPMGYVDLQSMIDASTPSGMQTYMKSEMLSGLTDEVIDAVLEYGAAATSPMSQILLHQLGGAMSRLPGDETAFPHRHGAFMATAVALWPSPTDDPADHLAWARDLWSRLSPASAGTYVNHLGSEGRDRIEQAYGSTNYARLARVKATWDPDNFFRLNQNIEPERR